MFIVPAMFSRVPLMLLCVLVLSANFPLNFPSVRSVAADCTVSPPPFGAMGDCPTTLPAGHNCRTKCLIGFAHNSSAPIQTKCDQNNVLTQQQCGSCSAGTFPQWNMSSLIKSLAWDTLSTQTLYGSSVALSADGKTMAAGAYGDNSGMGAVCIWIRSDSGTWVRQQKLIGSGSSTYSSQGYCGA